MVVCVIRIVPFISGILVNACGYLYIQAFNVEMEQNLDEQQ